MKNKWGRHIGVFALAAISSALMFSSKGITAKAADDVEWVYNYTGNVQSWTAPYDGKYKLEVGVPKAVMQDICQVVKEAIQKEKLL